MSTIKNETTRIRATVRLARFADLNGTRNALSQDEVVREARDQGISILDAMRARILLRIASGSVEVVALWLSNP